MFINDIYVGARYNEKIQALYAAFDNAQMQTSSLFEIHFDINSSHNRYIKSKERMQVFKNLIQELLPEHTRVNVQSNHDREAA